ncbi:MAG TPA: universal stress protein [Chthoniobacterales bacterium]|nr:universal stress protein [Chthoniobacterales bacterium]
MTNITDSAKATGTVYRLTDFGSSGQFPNAVKRILVATDLTRESERAIDFALALAKRFCAHLTLLHVYHESYPLQYLRGTHALEAMREERAHFLHALELAGSKAKERYSDCDIEFHEGEPWNEIVSTAKERKIDLIVISTHHYHWLERFICGSDADEILRRAQCPTLVVHADQE